MRFAARIGGILLLCLFLGGCRLYHLGNQGTFRTDIRTIHVSIIESNSFRRFLGQRLTESIVKEVESQTPYSIGSPGLADSYIRGRILSETKRGLTETVNDDLRDIQVNLWVEIEWTDRSGTPLLPTQRLRIGESERFVPEGGQSITTAQQEIIDRTARKIVQRMEMPW